MISSATPHYHEFHNSGDFKQHFKKRPFDQNAFDIEQTVDNTYKKIKPTSSVNSSSSQQTTKSTKTSFAAPSRSFRSLRMGTNYSRYYENGVETDLLSDTPRIIDLSTGESLESIPSMEQLQKSRKPKRPIELVENQDELLSILGTMEENKEDLIESSLHSPKRIRTSREHMCNFIEEEEEEIDPKVHRPIDNTLSSNKANSVDSQEKPQSSQSLLLYIYGKNPSNIKFTVPYQKAIARYMRSQFQHLNNNEEYRNEGKELILYHPRNDEFKDSFVDSSGKIFEIPEETMDLDVEAGQNGVFSCINDSYVKEEDQMDID